MTAAAQVLAPPALEHDEQLLLRFLIWHLRVRDLPPAVRDAAARLAAAHRHPRLSPVDDYVDAPYRVSALPRSEDGPMVDVSACAASVPAAVADLLAGRPQYVVVTDLLAPAEAIA